MNVERIRDELDNCLTGTTFTIGHQTAGKVRDFYELDDDRVVLISTDRQSAFDRILAAIPFKGQVLNLTSAWWFEQTKSIIRNHVLSVPDPNVTVAKKCAVFPIEFVVRGYITGTTNTSLWTVYDQGNRSYCEINFPEGLKKNQRLNDPVITPTTKEKAHDRPISPNEIINEGWMSEKDWQLTRDVALELFRFGQNKSRENGLILVDTKYEFGKDKDGNILLIDEIHTPDSSRYWIADSYDARFTTGQEPENIDKEFLRLWFMEHCDPYHDKLLPEAPAELVVELSRRYIQLYEMITRQVFKFPDESIPVIDRIQHNLREFV
jgi:phosphoribosylaminoimidazole-succinocarboxamide synthase